VSRTPEPQCFAPDSSDFKFVDEIGEAHQTDIVPVIVTVLTEERLLNNEDDLSRCFSRMVSKLIIPARYDGH
jgi:hypothetical protein